MDSIPPTSVSQGLYLGRMATLPRELILSILNHVAAPAQEAPRHLSPFLTCGREWFSLAYPFVWRMVCIDAITHAAIDPHRRAAYASYIEAFLDTETCGCRRCTQLSTFENLSPPNRACAWPVRPSSADALVMQTVVAFPRLRSLDLGYHQVKSSMVSVTQHITGLAENLTRLRVRLWADGHEAPGSLVALVSRLDNLEHLEVHRGSFCSPAQPPLPDRRRPYWPKLISARLFSHKKWESPVDIRYRDFPPWDVCGTLLSALSGAPNLLRLQVFVPEMVGSLVRPHTSRDPLSTSRRRPFPALEELMVAVESPRALQHLLELTALTRLVVLFDAAVVGKSMMAIFPQMRHLRQLKLLANSGRHPGYSWRSTFTVADMAAVVRPMKGLQSLTFNFPAWCLHCNHTEEAHKLLLLIATDSPSLEELHLGFRVPFPLPSWDIIPPSANSSSLHTLTIELHETYDYQSDATDVALLDIAKNARKLRRIFPLLRTLISKENGVRLDFAQ